MPYRFKRKETIATAVRRIAGERIAASRGRLNAIMDDPEEVIHDLRKDTKKLRALARLLRQPLGDAYASANDRLRAIANGFAVLRDHQVMVHTLDAVVAHADRHIPSDGLRAHLCAQCAHDRAQTDLIERADHARQALAEINDDVAAWPLPDDVDFDHLAPGLKRAYARGRKALQRVHDDGGATTVHEWRKRSKDLLYHLRLLRGCWKTVLGGWIDELDAMTSLLGDHHDVTVLATTVTTLGNEHDQLRDEAQGLALVIADHEQRLLTRALPHGARIYGESSGRFVDRFGLYWRIWHGKTAL